MGLGKAETLRIALGGQAVDMRTARIRQPHHLGTLVESLTSGIIDGLAEDLHVIIVPDKYYLAVTA